MSNRRDKFETKNAIQAGRKREAVGPEREIEIGHDNSVATSCETFSEESKASISVAAALRDAVQQRSHTRPRSDQATLKEGALISGSGPKRILCLWFPNWPIQRMVVEQPELRRQRIVLFRRDSRRGQVVSAVSPMAMRDGVRVDMPLSEAKSLLRSSGKFHLFEHDLASDLKAMEELADSLESFSPIIGLETIEAADFKRGRRPDSVFLEVTGLAHLFGDENQLARETFLHCDALGYLPRIAIGDTVGIAWGAARFFAGSYFREFAEPLILSSGDSNVVKQFPVEALRAEATVTDTLYQLGIETIGQLQRLSRNDLAMRFGNAIHKRLDQMLGDAEEPVVARRKPAEFVADQLLEFPTHHRETIEVIIARLVTELCAQMRTKQRGALEWTVKMVCQTGSPIEFRVNLFQPTATTKHVMPLVEMQLEQVLSPVTRKGRKRKKFHKQKKCVNEDRKQTETIHPSREKDAPQENASREEAKREAEPEGNPATAFQPEAFGIPDSEFRTDTYRYTTIQVQEIMVSVTSEVLLVQQQRQLFDENPRLDKQTLAQLINRLASRLGTEQVVYPLLQSGAQPEYSFRLRPLVDASRKYGRRKTKPPKLSHQLARPLRLFHPAQPLEVVCLHRDSEISSQETSKPAEAKIQHSPPALARRVLTDAEDGRRVGTPARPTLLCWSNLNSNSQSKSQKVIQSWGPERIETGWWRGLTVCRDYWRVETESQQHYWIYRDLRSGKWFLHGEF